MADVARNLEPVEEPQQYWRPALERRGPNPETELCPRCGTEFIIGSRFCYVCGSDRDLPGAARKRQSFDWKHWLDFSRLQQRMGLSIGSLIAFFVGCACVLAALLTGVMYTATTMIDWEAVQAWRMQWLLAAIAAFVCGMLLKRPALKTE
jgi:hypothetical protein